LHFHFFHFLVFNITHMSSWSEFHDLVHGLVLQPTNALKYL
jgi:hypothetical protein